MNTIVSLIRLEPQHASRVLQAAPGWRLLHEGGREAWLSAAEEAEVIVGWHPDLEERCLRPNTKLKWVQTWAAGVDELPFDVFARYGVVLTNGSGVHGNPISETVFAMMLSLTRQVHAAVRAQTEKRWFRPDTLGELHGKTLGLVGVGAIGGEIARIARAFGMTVLGVRRSGEPHPDVDRMYDLSAWEAILPESDYVVVTLPLTRDTEKFIGRDQFARMKRGAYFFNIGRGRTTDEAALVRALQEGKLAGAGLDVFEQEPLPESSPLWEMEQVIVCPHISGITDRYGERIIETFLSNLRDYVEGRIPSVNRVDLAAQY